MITYDHRNEFIDNSFQTYLIQKEYLNKPKCETTSNLQANSVLEKIQKIIANPKCMLNLLNNYIVLSSPACPN